MYVNVSIHCVYAYVHLHVQVFSTHLIQCHVCLYVCVHMYMCYMYVHGEEEDGHLKRGVVSL